MKNLFYQGKKYLAANEGAVSTEQMVLIFVALTIATVLFLFRNQVTSMVTAATTRLRQPDFNL